MNKRPLAPKFLNKLDNQLLINRPDTWSTRFHLVTYYSLLFMIALTAICFVVPMDHRERTFYGLWSGSAGVLALIGFIIWMVYLLRFNVFKHFGTVFPGDRIKTFVLYFIMIAMMMVVVYIPPVVESIRADRAYNSDELATDINRINELITKLEHDNISPDWDADTLIIMSSVNYPNNSQTSESSLQYVDSSSFRWRVDGADSIKRLRSDAVIIYKFYDLTFIDESRVDRYAKVHVKTLKELYYTAYLNPSVNTAIAQNELQQLTEKYAASGWIDDYYESPDYSNLALTIRNKYHLSYVDSGIDHIADRKYRLYNLDYSDYIRVTYYFALVLTLLVFAFRHSTTKTFFLSLLVGVVLSILSGLFTAILHLREEGILWLMLFYFASFVIISMLIFSAKKRSVISGIALNAFLLMTAFIPIICVALYYEYSKYETHYVAYGVYDPEYAKYIATRAQHFLIAEFAGGILLLIMIETLFKKLYRAWYSAPED